MRAVQTAGSVQAQQARTSPPCVVGACPDTVAGGPSEGWSSPLHLPASLRSRGITPLMRYYGRSDSCRVVQRLGCVGECVSPSGPDADHGPRLLGRGRLYAAGSQTVTACPRQVSLLHVHSRPTIPSPPTLDCSHRRFHTLPLSAMGFLRLSHPQVWASPFASRLASQPGRIGFLRVRTGRSPPGASHPASRRRRTIQLQAGARMPEEDLHLSDHARLQAH